MRHKHEERDAEPGAEQHGRAEDVQELEREIEVAHRSSRMARVNSDSDQQRNDLQERPERIGPKLRCQARADDQIEDRAEQHRQQHARARKAAPAAQDRARHRTTRRRPALAPRARRKSPQQPDDPSPLRGLDPSVIKPVSDQNNASPPMASGLIQNSRANQRSATLDGWRARMSSRLFGVMPVAAIHVAGSPTTPADKLPQRGRAHRTAPTEKAQAIGKNRDRGADSARHAQDRAAAEIRAIP